MTELSVVIITFNEAQNIARCLDSVKDLADEVIVLDSFSTDDTEQICLSKGVRFFQHAFDGHIEQKNRALTYSKFPLVLSLDADEALSDELKNSIWEVKKNPISDGYYLNRMTNYCGSWIHYSGWYPDSKLRLWRSGKGKWGGLNPHDKFELFAGDKNSVKLNGDILHYSYYSIDQHYRQAEYFSTIAAKAYFESGKRSGIYNMIFNPALKFFRNYFLKAGFLDGLAGFTVCRITAYETFLKYRKLRNLAFTREADSSETKKSN